MFRYAKHHHSSVTFPMPTWPSCFAANTWLWLLLVTTGSTVCAQQVAPGIYVDQISGNLSLEIKVGYETGNNKLLYGGLYNNGSDNVLEFRMLNASATGVSIDQDLGDVDSGQIFGLGDWCKSENYALMPYIKDFSVHALRYDLTSNSFDTILVAPSQTSQYTSTDCISFDLGMNTGLVVAANNFDAKGLDYFRSDDDGDNWNLAIQYRLDSDIILDAFANGFRDTHDATSDLAIGSVYQRGNGEVESVKLDLSGNVLGTRTVADGSLFIDNGELKELDGVTLEEYCFGAANLGDALTGAFIDINTGNVGLGDLFANSRGVNPLFEFSGIDLTAKRPSATSNFIDLYYLSNNLIKARFALDTQQFNNPQIIVDHPFAGNGGPVAGVSLQTTERYYAFGLNLGFAAGGLAGTGVATIDPVVAVTAPAQTLLGLPSVAVPALKQQGMLVLLLAILGIGAVMLARRGV